MSAPSIASRENPLRDIIPPLENGDRLDRDEFLRRWEATPRIKHAELIYGIVYMNAAVRFRSHGQPHTLMTTWLGSYAMNAPGLLIADNCTVELDDQSLPQPDLVMIIDHASMGQTRINEDDYLEGPPELVVEIAASSASRDLHQKLKLYEEFGVKEYLVWNVPEMEIKWFVNLENGFAELAPSDHFVYKSQTFPGLWLDAQALVGRDEKSVFATLQEGLQTAEFESFVNSIAQQT